MIFYACSDASPQSLNTTEVHRGFLGLHGLAVALRRSVNFEPLHIDTHTQCATVKLIQLITDAIKVLDTSK